MTTLPSQISKDTLERIGHAVSALPQWEKTDAKATEE